MAKALPLWSYPVGKVLMSPITITPIIVKRKKEMTRSQPPLPHQQFSDVMVKMESEPARVNGI